MGRGSAARRAGRATEATERPVAPIAVAVVMVFAVLRASWKARRSVAVAEAVGGSEGCSDLAVDLVLADDHGVEPGSDLEEVGDGGLTGVDLNGGQDGVRGSAAAPGGEDGVDGGVEARGVEVDLDPVAGREQDPAVQGCRDGRQDPDEGVGSGCESAELF